MNTCRLLMATTVPITLRTFLRPFAHYFRAKGWRVDAAAKGVSACTACTEAFDHVWELDWSRNPLTPQNLLRAPQQVRAVVLQERYDLIHVHTPVAAFVTRYALRGLRKEARPKVIYSAHGFHFYRGGPLLKSAVFLALERLAGRWTDYLVVVNSEDLEAAKRYRIVRPTRVRYIPGFGVDTMRYLPAAVPAAEVVRVRQELGVSTCDRLFLMVAEFIPRKRHRDVLRALVNLGRPGVHLALAGEGPLMDDMKQLACDLGIADQVHFLGFRRDIPALMRASVATLLPSEQEGLPQSVMESLCLEVLVIGADIRGTRDLLKQGCGLLVKVGDEDELSRAMTWALDYPEESRIMSLRGRKRMGAYDLQRILEAYEALYVEALEGGKRCAPS